MTRVAGQLAGTSLRVMLYKLFSSPHRDQLALFIRCRGAAATLRSCALLCRINRNERKGKRGASPKQHRHTTPVLLWLLFHPFFIRTCVYVGEPFLYRETNPSKNKKKRKGNIYCKSVLYGRSRLQVFSELFLLLFASWRSMHVAHSKFSTILWLFVNRYVYTITLKPSNAASTTLFCSSPCCRWECA